MDYKDIENIIGYVFRDKGLLTTALTHSAYANERGETSYERLEYLGDALVDFVTAESMFLSYPNYGEGKLTGLRKKAVCREALAEARGMEQLSRHVKVNTATQVSSKIKADVFESVTAAIYLDGGFDEAKAFVLRSLDVLAESLDKKREDYKSALLELAQKLNLRVEFDVIDEYGPDHDKTYVCAVRVSGKQFSIAEGTSKKRAEQNASKLAIQRLKG